MTIASSYCISRSIKAGGSVLSTSNRLYHSRAGRSIREALDRSNFMAGSDNPEQQSMPRLPMGK